MTFPTDHHHGHAAQCARCGHQSDHAVVCGWCEGEVCPCCRDAEAPVCRRCAAVLAGLGCLDLVVALR